MVDYEVETSIPVLKTCLDCFTARRSQPNALQLEKVVSLVFKRVMKLSNSGTLLSHALNDVELTDDFVDDLSNALRFSISEKISFGLALTDFERSDAKTSGKADSSPCPTCHTSYVYLSYDGFLVFRFVGRNLLLSQIEELSANTGLIESTEQIQNLLLFLQKSEDLSSHLDSFLQILSSARPSDDFSFAPTPILSQEADVFRCHCFHLLSLFPSICSDCDSQLFSSSAAGAWIFTVILVKTRLMLS